MAFSYSPKIVTDSLVLYLDAANPYSYVSGSLNWNDLSRSQTSGSLINGPTYNSANNGSIVFDGVDDYATVSSSLFTFGTGNFTLDVWVKPLSFTTYGHMLSLPDQNTFTLKFDTTADSPGGGIIYYYPNTNYGSTPSWKATLNTWNNVTLVRLSNVGYTYLNGTFTGTSGNFNNNITTQLLSIHKGFISGELASSQMAAIKIYNRALSAQEVLQNYNATKGRFGLT
jgi:hypothetical protein